MTLGFLFIVSGLAGMAASGRDSEAHRPDTMTGLGSSRRRSVLPMMLDATSGGSPPTSKNRTHTCERYLFYAVVVPCSAKPFSVQYRTKPR